MGNQEPEVVSEILTLPSGQELSSTKLPAFERKLFEEKIPEKFVEPIFSKQNVHEIESTKIVKKVKKAKVGNKTIMQVTEQVNDEKPEITTEIVILPSGEEISISQVSEPERTKLIKALPDKHSKEEETIIHVESLEPSTNFDGKSESHEIIKTWEKTKVGNKILTKVLEQKDGQEAEVISEILNLPSGQEISLNKLPAPERKLFEEKIPEKFVEQMIIEVEPKEICELISSKQTIQAIEPTKIVKKVKKAKVGNKTIMQVTEQINDEKPEITTEIVILPTGEEISSSQFSEPERTKLIKALPDKYSKEEEIITHVETIEPSSSIGGISEPKEVKKIVKKTKVGNKILTKVFEQKDNQEPEVISEILTLPSGQEVSSTKLPAFERKLFEEKIPEKFV